MFDPLLALLIFLLFSTLAAVLLWPRRGVVARLRRMSRFTERILLEDALKHVWTCETLERDCTLESLAGQLEVPTGRAAALLARLAERELVRSGSRGPRLTPAGRESALRLVRAHRLWERYLADRTGVPPAEWHAEAERMEHNLSHADTERLAARLGHPSWDPHGDPIPSSEGDVPDLEGTSLAALAAGQAAEVVHVEDEPPEVYEALIAEGFVPGLRLEVLARRASTVWLRAGGREWETTALAARNVTVRPLPAGAAVGDAEERLGDLRPGESATVVEISPACRGAQRRRLLDLGIVPGTTVTAELASAWGDPVAYRIRGALLALRREQADWVRVHREAGGPDSEDAGRGERAVADAGAAPDAPRRRTAAREVAR